MDKDIKHAIDKIEIKQLNNIDAIGDMLQLLYDTANEPQPDEKLESQYKKLLSQFPALSEKPDEASRQLYQIYKQQYPTFKDATIAFINNSENEFTKKRYATVFSLTRKLVEHLTDKMIDFGEWEEEAGFEDIPKKPFLEADLSKRSEYTKLLLSRLDLLEIVNPHLEEALSENNKGKYMTVSALLSGIMFDIAMVLKYME